jgi:4-carboxymuconolactone decarboxylase
MTPEGRRALAEIRKVRGYTLPLHDALAETNPEFLKRYGQLASYVIFGDKQGRALDLKTRFLVMVGITTAVKGDREGIEWAAVRAIQNGASWDEVYEAAFLAALPAGVPSFEAACKALKEMKAGRGWVPQKLPGKAKRTASRRRK